jgi:UDP-N-acetylglucosamine--N-acetylmuramyl-(pentapeptide) pyrophosphoryl-undecaprenol N-acetylglucosamine transferase
MRILAVGGGSGGHVTPVAAVFDKLQQIAPDAELRFWCDAKFYRQAKATMQTLPKPVTIETVLAGKLRRYHKLPIWKQLLRFDTIVLPNIIDSVKMSGGFIQSVVKLTLWRPDVIFAKGGYVCLPVGLAAKVLRIPLVIHDSDAHPGLTSRILSRWATSIATGAPLNNYSYPKAKTHYIGIPISDAAKPMSFAKAQAYKKEKGFDPNLPLVAVIGGGLGAQPINQALLSVLEELTSFAAVGLIAGNANIDAVNDAAAVNDKTLFQAYGHLPVTETLELYAAADIVVTRAGATTLLELAALAKPIIIIPNEYLTGGHQIKNAAVYKKAKAAIVLEESKLEQSPQLLTDAINSVLLSKRTKKQLADNIATFAKPNAALNMAELILKASGRL